MISEHVYTKELVGNDALVMPAGERDLCFDIGFPHAADLTRLTVIQTSGPAVGFQVNLYNRQVCAIHAGSNSSSALPSAVPKSLAKVIPTQVQHLPGQPVELFHPDGYTFRNTEGTFTVPIKLIYLEIVVDDASADTTWAVSLACRPKF